MAVQMSKGWLNIDHKLQGKQEIKGREINNEK